MASRFLGSLPIQPAGSKPTERPTMLAYTAQIGSETTGERYDGSKLDSLWRKASGFASLGIRVQVQPTTDSGYRYNPHAVQR